MHLGRIQRRPRRIRLVT